MRSCATPLISSVLICLVLATAAAFFKNTEAFLNGHHHFDQARHHDYDQNGRKESTHQKHQAAGTMVKLTFVPLLARLIVLEAIWTETAPVFEQKSLTPLKFSPVIFRPPILA